MGLFQHDDACCDYRLPLRLLWGSGQDALAELEFRALLEKNIQEDFAGVLPNGLAHATLLVNGGWLLCNVTVGLGSRKSTVSRENQPEQPALALAETFTMGKPEEFRYEVLWQLLVRYARSWRIRWRLWFRPLIVCINLLEPASKLGAVRRYQVKMKGGRLVAYEEIT